MAGSRSVWTRKIFSDYSYFTVHKITSDVITKEESKRILEQSSVHIIDKVIRNGQEEHVQGDVLFLGTVHEGGKLFVGGNIFVLGNIEGIVQAGAPDLEDKMIIGDVHNAQQVRIGEQFEILADTNREMNSGTVIYVNDLHVWIMEKLRILNKLIPSFTIR